MSEYRNPNDPLGRNTPYDLNAGSDNTAWGWVAGAVFVVLLLALAFGIGHKPNQAGPNTFANNTPPATIQPAPAPSGPASSAYSPTPINPANPAPLSPTQHRP
jgi:hypothetical protein